ncbi:sensor histidine kinase [Ruminococcus sp.]|uniref:sensor histidine kinase n=1 Tax=Ruminococcus sp. TaxID=41978 RepID=UPI002E80BABC|nr:HAMP domain-containing sensor histidine kinase [Ruminococcus sp.]MEE3491790.1 HAMP domain-containing sensor histidine kinase [Ruminococcus sp.]
MKKLRRKIVLGVFISATIVFALSILFVSIFLNAEITRRADAMTELIADNQGEIPPKNEIDKPGMFSLYSYNEDSPFRMRYFAVKYEGNDHVVVYVDHNASIDEGKAVAMADIVKMSKLKTGDYNDFRYRVSDENDMVVFVDYTYEYNAVDLLTLMLSLLAVVFIVLITVVFWFLSNRIVKPFEENSRMQKQFITDASHEIKTPIAIISANAEVLAYKNGESEWLNNITTQVRRISELVGELLTLNRLEEVDEISDIEAVNLSEMTEAVCADFEEVFRSKNVQTSYELQPDVTINGNTDQLKRLVSVLVENASKYVTDGGEFLVTLNKELRYTTLSIYNTCEIDEDGDYKHLFDRFYRPDSSRTSSTGGHGIGLSIAKRITVLHGGSIEAVPSKDGLSFNVKLSNRLKTHHKKRK